MSDDDPGEELDPNRDLASRLRRRAEQLRATPAAPQDETELEPIPLPLPGPDDDSEAPFAAGTLGGVDDPDDSELLRRWEAEDHLETDSPHRNWSPLVALLVVAAVIALIVLAFRLVSGDDAADGPGGGGGEAVEAASVLDEDPPSLDELTADVTVPPGPEQGLAVAEKGVTIVEDRFDPARREGTFAVIIENPHPDWLAQGVQVDVQFLDAAGAPVGADNAFVEVVLPSQRVAVAALFFDAPTVPVADLGVTIDVARWRETEPFSGGFVTEDVVTEEAEFSGVRTSFVLRSEFPEALTDVGITAVYRGPMGQIVGGSDTFVELVEPGVDTPAELSLLANIPLDQIAATELYPAASFGFDPDE